MYQCTYWIKFFIKKMNHIDEVTEQTKQHLVIFAYKLLLPFLSSRDECLYTDIVITVLVVLSQ